MAMKSNQPYQNLGPFSHPPRSRLFRVEPIKTGAQLGESLTSLTTRLAEAHCLPLGVLMERENAPIIAKIHGGGNLHKIYDHTAALNGTGVMALSLASALERLTGQKNSIYLRWHLGQSCCHQEDCCVAFALGAHFATKPGIQLNR